MSGFKLKFALSYCGYLIACTVFQAEATNTTCDAGYVLDPDLVTCSKCPRGTYISDTMHQLAQCHACPIHAETGMSGSTLSNGSTNISNCFFEPEIKDFYPRFGPVSGGTEVTIELYAFEDFYHPTYAYVSRTDADILGFNASEKQVTVQTHHVNTTINGTVYLTFSIDRLYESNQVFNYVEDPIIEYIDSFKTFISGGLTIEVRGQYLRNVMRPQFVITMIFRGQPYSVSAPCNAINDTLMHCTTPDLKEMLNAHSIPYSLNSRSRRNIEAQTFNDADKQFYPGFTLDGVEEYKNLSGSPVIQGQEQFLVYLDPEYYRFEEDEFLRHFDPDDRFLYIEGARLNHACDEEDVIVQIGVEFCNVTVLATNMLTCIPPENQPEVDPLGYGPRETPRVSVTTGNLEFFIGFLDYSPPEAPQAAKEEPNEIMYGIIGGSAGIALLLIIIIIILVLLVRRRKSKRLSKAEVEQRLGRHQGSRIEQGRYVSSNRGVQNGGTVNYTDILEGSENMSNGTLDSEGYRIPRGRQMSENITPPISPDPYGRTRGSMEVFMSDINGTPKLFPRYKGSDSPVNNDDSGDILNELEESLRLTVHECMVPSEKVTLLETIGTGYFGKVFKGILHQKENENELDETVAVKTIQGTLHTVKEVGAFLEEAVIMKDFDHENVLSLIGIVMRGSQPYVILPYMANGDLKTYIREPSRSMKVKELLGFGQQIAKGMIYLAKQKFVHRDLATRNCMLSDSHVVKIADFGLSRDIYKTDYYRVEDRHRPLPVRWMAVESLTNGMFSSKSDVWSFGVCVWELLTRGCSPYPDVDTFNIKQYVCSGRRLSQPDHTPDNVYEMLESCWLEDPDDRPDFSEIYATIEDILDTSHPDYAKIIDVS